jgi:hypothetical protein
MKFNADWLRDRFHQDVQGQGDDISDAAMGAIVSTVQMLDETRQAEADALRAQIEYLKAQANHQFEYARVVFRRRERRIEWTMVGIITGVVLAHIYWVIRSC